MLAHVSQEYAVAGSAWSEGNLWMIALMVLAGGLYSRGLYRLWKAAGLSAGIPIWRAVCFSSGMTALGVALLSPVDAIGSELFSVHMLQHELLMLVAAPLLVLGQPLVLYLWAFPADARKGISSIVKSRAVKKPWRMLMYPFFAWVLHAVILWVWHFPVLFEAGLKDERVHVVQHISFFVSALLFWASLVGTHSRLRTGAAVVYILTTFIHTGILGALLTFSNKIWYPFYEGRTQAWGLSSLEDQQLGGLIMWIPAGFVLLIAGVIAAARVLNLEWQANGRQASHEG